MKNGMQKPMQRPIGVQQQITKYRTKRTPLSERFRTGTEIRNSRAFAVEQR